MTAHVDLMRNDWQNMERHLVRRVPADKIDDDPVIGAQVKAGWATYYDINEPHEMAACPFKDTTVLK